MSGSTKSPVVIPGLDLARAKRYSRLRLAVFAISTGWSAFQFLWFASDRRATRLKHAIGHRVPDTRLVPPLFFAASAVLSWLASLPLAYAGGYLVERRFGLSRQATSGWLADRLKALVIGTAIQTPLLTLAYQIIRQRPRDWWLVLSGAAVPLTVLLSHLAPVLLMPLFNRFVPLRNAALAARTRTLAHQAGVRVRGIYEMDMSRQTEKPNAMFTGIGRSKRIVVGDTLLKRFSPDGVEAVIAHELAHQVHGDVWRWIAFSAGTGFGLAWLTSRLAQPMVWATRHRTGVSEVGDEASLPILAALLSLFGVVLMPIQAAFSRAMERRADRFALALTGDGAAYAGAMERLAVLSLADPDPPRLVVFLLSSHPPLGERIRAARAGQPWEDASERGATITRTRG